MGMMPNNASLAGLRWHAMGSMTRWRWQLRDRGKTPQPMLVAVANQFLHVA